jgi:DNA-binding GntR family transcriptional regulator
LSLWFLTFPFFFRRVRIVGKEYIFLSRDWLYPKIIDDLNKE